MSELNVLLPSLIPNHNFDKPQTAGEWTDVSSDTLIGISNGLDVKPAKLQVNSIPDIWARMLLFEAALFDVNHKLHAKTIGEWRGMLALLALKDIKHLQNLKAIPLNIKAEPDASDKWHTSLSRLLPSTQIYRNTTWNNLFIFLAEDVVFGITSPTTLVATSTYYSDLELSDSKVSWYDNKIFQDPTKHSLSRAEKEGVGTWLGELGRKLRNADVIDRIRDNKLLTLIDDYLDVISKDLQKEGITLGAFSPSVFGFGISGVEAGIFPFLDKPASTPRGNTSHVTLVPSTGRSPQKPMLLVDESIAEQWQRLPNEVSVYEALTLGSIPYEGLVPNEHDKVGDKQITEAEIWRPQDLLTEKLYYITNQNAFPGAFKENWYGNPPKINNQPISIIIPLQKNLLEHLSPEDLLDQIVFIQGNSGEITVKFTVNLTGFRELPTPYVIEKTYSRESMIDFSQVPILEIFPNFSRDTWKAYFVTYSSDNINATFTATPYKTNDTPIVLPMLNNSSGKRLIWRLESFPEAMVCKFKEKGALQEDEIGLLLLQKPLETPQINRQYTVGIDFGASGTMVYYSDGNERSQLNFENRKLSITDKTDSQKADVLKFFLPEEEITPAFLTLYQDFNNNDEDHSSLLNGHIYYLYGVPDLTGDSDVHSNLKWSTDANTKFRVKSFLAQICLQTSAEIASKGASSVYWKFSYPTAFTNTQKTSYQAIWTQIIEQNSNLTGIHSTQLDSLSESIASAECFLKGGATFDNEPATTASGAIFVDIGGSTSDISIWNDNSLCLQLSLRYAGRDVFLEYLWKHLEVLQVFGIDIQVLDKVKKSNNKDRFWAQADSVLKSNSTKIFKDLPVHLDDKRIKSLIQHLAIGLSGLFYYLGLCIKYLNQKDEYSGRIPNIYFGGNASQMFRWLSGGAKTNQNHPFTELFQKVFIAAAGEDLKGVLDLWMSVNPKHESAYGLVCPPELNATDERNIVISGESFAQKGTSYEWNQVIDEEFLDVSPIEPPEEFDQLNNFINSFNEYAKKNKDLLEKINFTDQLASRVYNSLDTSLKKNNEDTQKVIFILALKGLLDTLS